MKSGVIPSASPRALNRSTNIVVMVASVEHAERRLCSGSFGVTNASPSAFSIGIPSLSFDTARYSHAVPRKTHLSHDGFASLHYNSRLSVSQWRVT